MLLYHVTMRFWSHISCPIKPCLSIWHGNFSYIHKVSWLVLHHINHCWIISYQSQPNNYSLQLHLVQKYNFTIILYLLLYQQGLEYACLYLLQRVKTPHHKKCVSIDTKLHLMLWLLFWRSGVWNTPSLLLLPGSFWPGVVVPVRVPFMDQIHLYKNHLFSVRLGELKNLIESTGQKM